MSFVCVIMELQCPGCKHMITYGIGVLFYWFRVIICSTKVGKQVIEQAYNKDTKSLIYRWIISMVFIQLWLFMCRINNGPQQFAQVPFCFFLMFDLIPFPKFNAFWQKIINEITRLSMPIYILHYSFLEKAAPRNFPYITALNQNIEVNHSWINAFSSWLYLLIFGMLSYPLWFMQRPLEVLPVWIKSIVEKKHFKNKKQFIIDLVLSFVGLLVSIILIILAQTDVFGHDFVEKPPLQR
ncbi:Hypothetical_protein [Hexamita inflata]|uniref:Hypothetical_protein n=1 Tax=Hexamita inflata TaxID=28002 RepID=A0AA86TYX7_9EUKA|nr:Hypothetical protein HINF_LOCUS19997 [Hexamita inflata]